MAAFQANVAVVAPGSASELPPFFSPPIVREDVMPSRVRAGCMIPVLVHAGGTVLATEGNDVDLPVGTVMRVRFESPVRVATRGR